MLVSQAGRVGPTWGFPHVRQQGSTLAYNQVGEGRVRSFLEGEKDIDILTPGSYFAIWFEGFV